METRKSSGMSLAAPAAAALTAASEALTNAPGVFYTPVGYFVGFGIDKFDVSDRVWSVLDRTSYALFAFAAQAHGPIPRRAFADLSLPLVADLGKIIRPTVRRATGFRTVHYDDAFRRELHAFVGAGDDRVVPLCDFAEENSSQGLRSEIQRRVDSWDVVGGNYGAHHRGKMQNPGAMLILVGLELLVVHGAIGGAEIHGAFGDLLDAAAGADRLIVDLKIGVPLVVFVEPLGIHGVRKCCARTVNRECAIRPQDTGDGENYQEHSCNSFHGSSPSEIIVFSRECKVCASIVTALLQRVHSCLNRRVRRNEARI